jgi:NDP-sugar pyrophosphorylase family protein
MILAAGHGRRLRPLTVYWAKPALPVLGRPLIHYVIAGLRKQGVHELVVNLHHQAETVTAALSDGDFGDVKVHTLHEPEILGTAGAIKNAQAHFRKETFVVVNGDTLLDMDLSAALAFHRRKTGQGTLLLRRQGPGGRYTKVKTDRQGRIVGLGDRSRTQRPLMFSGAWLLDPGVFSRIRRGFARMEADVLPGLIAQGEAFGISQDGAWFDLGTPRRYLATCLELLRQGLFRDWWRVEPLDPPPASLPGTRVAAGPGCTIDPESRCSGEVIMGTRCRVGRNALLERSVLWDDVVVGEGAVVRNSVIASGVRLAPGSRTVGLVVLRLGPEREGFRAKEVVANHVLAPLGE